MTLRLSNPAISVKNYMSLFGGDAWLGGYYELAIELGPPSDDRLMLALETVWNAPGVEGCYLRRDIDPTKQPRVPPRLPDDHGSHLYGVATLPNSLGVPCCTVIVREEAGPDWLDFCLPLARLGKAIPAVGGYPFSEGSSRSWRGPIDDWLAEIGQGLFNRVPFLMGLIGFEVSGVTDAEHLKGDMPDDRWVGYLWPQENKLQYFPANRW